MLSAMLYFKA